MRKITGETLKKVKILKKLSDFTTKVMIKTLFVLILIVLMIRRFQIQD